MFIIYTFRLLLILLHASSVFPDPISYGTAWPLRCINSSTSVMVVAIAGNPRDHASDSLVACRVQSSQCIDRPRRGSLR
jgi:hypothetical protein